jgi:SAM-dependent methyltransferase
MKPPDSWRDLLVQPYNDYFASQYYEERYPRANPATLAFLRQHGVDDAANVLDVGCGNGRYGLALLDSISGRLVGCDISEVAITAFRSRLSGHPGRERVRLLVGDIGTVSPEARFDRILMMFGVLSHVGPREARVESLRQLRVRAHASSRLLLTVPSVWRRMPRELLRSLWTADRDTWGDVSYQRPIYSQLQTFHYHLYSVARLRRELAEGGWRLEVVEAESILTETQVCHSQWAARLDALLRHMVPAALGYGLRAMASPL